MTAAVLRLTRDYRLWALLPAHVTHIGLEVNPGRPEDVGEIIATIARPKFPKGFCRKCGCSQFDPCFTRIGPCGWADHTKTLCTACEGRQ